MKIGAVYPQIELGGNPESVDQIGRAVETLGYDHIVFYDHVVGAGLPQNLSDRVFFEAIHVAAVDGRRGDDLDDRRAQRFEQRPRGCAARGAQGLAVSGSGLDERAIAHVVYEKPGHH